MTLSLHRHRLYGLAIESVFPLPGAPVVSQFDRPPDLTMTWEPEGAWDAARWRTTLPAASRAYPSISVDDDGWTCLTWDEAMRFVISPQRDRVRLISREAKLEFAPTVVVGIVLGYILHLRGTLCLHGSVLERDGQAFAILGYGGAGKSTLAAALMQRGATLLSDDLVVISRTATPVEVELGCVSLRLDADAAKHLLGEGDLPRVPYLNKVFWDVSDATDQSDGRDSLRSKPLARMYFLQNGQEERHVAIEPESPATEALGYLIAAWYPPGHLRLLSGERLRDIGTLAASVPLRVIRYSKSWALLPRLAELVCP